MFQLGVSVGINQESSLYPPKPDLQNSTKWRQRYSVKQDSIIMRSVAIAKMGMSASTISPTG